jgi:glycosyltransferase involved in cell wall biosynthesis
MRLTITLPSINEHALKRALENIQDTTSGGYEVVVVSSTEPPAIGNIATHIKDTILAGANAGHAQALGAARGDFIFPWVDDHVFAHGWDETLFEEFFEREKEHQFLVMGARNAPHVGTVFGIYYPYFPLMRREYALRTGWFDPAYRCGFADADLGLRVWRDGGRCEWSSKIIIQPHQDDSKKGTEPHTTDADTHLFVSRWSSTFGVTWPVERVRDFNRDIVPEGQMRSYSPGQRRWS